MKVTMTPVINVKSCYCVPRLQVSNETISVVMPEKNSVRKELKREATSASSGTRVRSVEEQRSAAVNPRPVGGAILPPCGFS